MRSQDAKSRISTTQSEEAYTQRCEGFLRAGRCGYLHPLGLRRSIHSSAPSRLHDLLGLLARCRGPRLHQIIGPCEASLRGDPWAIVPAALDAPCVQREGHGLRSIAPSTSRSRRLWHRRGPGHPPLPRPGGSLRFRLARRRTRPGATGAVGLPGGRHPILLVHRPAAVGLLHPGLGYVYPTKPVGLADIHLGSTSCLMMAILPRLVRPDTEMSRAFLNCDSPYSVGYGLPRTPSRRLSDKSR